MTQRTLLLFLLGWFVTGVGGIASSSEPDSGTTMSVAVVGSGGASQGGYRHWVCWTVGQCAVGVATGPRHIHEAGFWHNYQAVFSDVDPTLPETPTRCSLILNSANPSRGATELILAVPERSRVSLRLYDVSGRLVQCLADGIYEPGYHEFTVRSEGLCAGIYLCRLSDGDFSHTQPLVLLR